jgi:hypothetical protein
LEADTLPLLQDDIAFLRTEFLQVVGGINAREARACDQDIKMFRGGGQSCSNAVDRWMERT